MPNDDRYFGKTIDEHYDTGSCWLCGKSVEYSQGYHTPTGAHWDCVSALRSRFEDLATERRTVPYLARANGGHYIHTVDPRTNASLCGHSPRDTARRMRSRGRWIEVRDVPRGCRRCPHCQRLSLAKQGAEQASGEPTHQPLANNSDTDRDTRTRDLFEDQTP
ncbi:hypothetical protein [Cupriavidus sp. Marseille-Q8015]